MSIQPTGHRNEAADYIAALSGFVGHVVILGADAQTVLAPSFRLLATSRSRLEKTVCAQLSGGGSQIQAAFVPLILSLRFRRRKAAFASVEEGRRRQAKGEWNMPAMRNGLTWKKATLAMTTLLLFASGCSSAGDGSQGPTEKETPAKPVTLKMYTYGALNEELFERLFVQPVKQKYPHITLEMINAANVPIAELAVSGNEMDILTGWGSLLNQFGNYRLLADLTPYIAKQGIDLNRFEASNLEGVRLQSEAMAPGSLFALPFGYNFYATFYNKDIFDKFAVPYPSDGMTWNDAIALGKKLTRMENGIQYKGLDPEGIEKLGNTFPLPYVDAKTEKATLNTDGWRRVFELVKSIHDIPGNDFNMTNHSGTVKRFIQDKNVAMLAAPEVLNSMADADFNWDLAEYPSFPENPHQSGMVQTFVLQLAANSKHPEEAMQVIQLATSDEVQTALSRSGVFLSGLGNESIIKQFGADHPLLKNKHIEAILKTKAAPYVVQTRFTKVRSILEAKYRDYVAGKKDANTALREAQEEADAYIAAEKHGMP